MAEEEVVAASPGLVPSDHKRKLEDIEPQAPPVEMPLNSAVDPDATASDSSEAKRPRLVDEKTDGLASENGFKAEQSDEPVKEEEEAFPQNEVTKQAEDGTAQAEEAQETAKPQQVEGTTKETEQQSTDNHATTDAELGKDEKFEADGGQEPGKVENFGADGSQEPPTKEESKQPSNEVPQQEVDDGSTITRRIEVPNAKLSADWCSHRKGRGYYKNARLSPLSGGFNQQGNRPQGNTGPPQWGSFGHTVPTASYDFQRRRPYPSQNSHYQPPYGGYPSHQMAPRSNFGSSWEQRPHNFQGPPHSGGYNYYSRHGSVSVLHLASIRGHGPRPTPAPAMGAVSSQSSYNYGQPHGRADYAHPPPYSHAFHQHSYGNGYGEKYENHTPVLHPYGGHGSSQPGYAPPGPQSAYAPQQQYGKPYSYVQSQGPQTYGPPANQPGEVPYQGPTGQSYSPNVPPQQQYPYASGPLQQSYPPCGSAPPGDGYNQPPPVTGQAYSQQGGQSVPGYSQPSAQQATAYAQANTAAGYGQYPPSQQGYSDQAAPNNAAYGYQGTQDSGYGSGPVTTYGAAPSGQVTYAQPTATQATYDQSGGYAAAPVSAPVAYGNTVSPQLGYPQYDSTQMYAAPQ